MATGRAEAAVWVVTPNGLGLSQKIDAGLTGGDLFYSQRLAPHAGRGQSFKRLTEAVAAQFHRYRCHIFIMATGIVVRAIAPLIVHKTTDPAVVVIDDRGHHVISLLAGHIGGANQVARTLAKLLDADPVITTATDVNARPAIDLIAQEAGLKIENPEAIKRINMALLNDQPIRLYDPYRLLTGRLPRCDIIEGDRPCRISDDTASVWVDDRLDAGPSDALKLRPRTLVAGIGCNRHTPQSEIKALLLETLAGASLSLLSLGTLASIDVKSDETGLLALAEALDLPIRFYSREILNQVRGVRSPSAMVAKHVGVTNVCEAAAIQAAHNGQLIVPKQKRPNVTVAIARRASMLSALDPVI